VVIDASALLALLQREPGHASVLQALSETGAAMSAVNFTEVGTKLHS
jgi:PIN domain nuclease of toxin-antitoxin system